MPPRSFGADVRVVAIPLERELETPLEVHLRPPPRDPLELLRVDVLAIDLPRGVARAPDVGLETGAGEARHDLDHLANPVRLPAARVEGLTPHVVRSEERRVGKEGRHLHDGDKSSADIQTVVDV